MTFDNAKYIKFYILFIHISRSTRDYVIPFQNHLTEMNTNKIRNANLPDLKMSQIHFYLIGYNIIKTKHFYSRNDCDFFSVYEVIK